MLARGLFVLVDGVGGQAAGGKAADVALTMLQDAPRAGNRRQRRIACEKPSPSPTTRSTASRRCGPNGRGWPACSPSPSSASRASSIGHVGDTRLYKLRGDGIEKVTRDHSPVGEREDSNEISEREAMRHRRRNEVYRDVGSEPHAQTDPDFIDLHEIPFEPDAALLLCSDGLTDLVESAAINQIVTQLAGRPHDVVHALIEAANDAGGKDNVTVVYVEGELFAAGRARRARRSAAPSPARSTLRSDPGIPDVRFAPRGAAADGTNASCEPRSSCCWRR